METKSARPIKTSVPPMNFTSDKKKINQLTVAVQTILRCVLLPVSDWPVLLRTTIVLHSNPAPITMVWSETSIASWLIRCGKSETRLLQSFAIIETFRPGLCCRLFDKFAAFQTSCKMVFRLMLSLMNIHPSLLKFAINNWLSGFLFLLLCSRKKNIV